MMMNETASGWIYAGVQPSNSGRSTQLRGVLVFDRAGKLVDARNGAERWILRGVRIDEPEAVKQRIVRILQRTEGKELRVNSQNIFLVNPDVYECVSRKVDSFYYETSDQYANLKKPLTIYFSPWRNVRTGKVKSNWVIMVDANGKVYNNWSDPIGGRTLGWVHSGWGKSKVFKLMSEFLGADGIELTGADRVYWLSPQGMGNKLVQLGINEHAWEESFEAR